MKKLIWIPFFGFFIAFIAHNFFGSNVVYDLLEKDRNTGLNWVFTHIIGELALIWLVALIIFK